MGYPGKGHLAMVCKQEAARCNQVREQVRGDKMAQQGGTYTWCGCTFVASPPPAHLDVWQQYEGLLRPHHQQLPQPLAQTHGRARPSPLLLLGAGQQLLGHGLQQGGGAVAHHGREAVRHLQGRGTGQAWKAVTGGFLRPEVCVAARRASGSLLPVHPLIVPA